MVNTSNYFIYWNRKFTSIINIHNWIISAIRIKIKSVNSDRIKIVNTIWTYEPTKFRPVIARGYIKEVSLDRAITSILIITLSIL